MDAAQFFDAGWTRFPYDQATAEWAARARPVAEECLADEHHRARWLRCGGTWFVGAEVFPNDATGAVFGAGVPPLANPAVRFIANVLDLGDFEWDRAQISVFFPGYPQPAAGESEAAFRFRRDRDAAHVDGLKRAEHRRRRLGEPHGFILGLPLTEAPADAAPLVVWQGSHEIIRRVLRERLEGVPPNRWASEDLTEAYGKARQECFETCHRLTLHACPGEAYLVHRLALHGVAPWAAEAKGERMIAYFRPNPFPGAAPTWWLTRP